LTNWRSAISSVMQWLYPGLRVKRWLLLSACGLAAIFLGLTLLIGPDLLAIARKILAPLMLYPRSIIYNTLLLISGLGLLLLGLQRAANAAKEVLVHDQNRPIIDVLFTKRYLERGPRLVVVGGGTGLSILLRELKEYTSNLTAVVTVTDDGGSSGRLRGELGMLPPGDIRSCLLAIADTEPLMEKLFRHRFTGGVGLEGHSFGNLFIAAMTEMFGFQEAVKRFGRVLAIRGQVFPVTLEMVQLEAEDFDGHQTRGQSALYQKKGPLKKIALDPPSVKPLPEVLAAIAGADAIILGPGSLFTSIIPNLLVNGIVEAMRNSQAVVFYICNVMTQPGETTGFSVADHVQALLDHSLPGLLDYVIVNSDFTVSRNKLQPFLEKGSSLVRPDYQRLQQQSRQIISGPFISHAMPTRHHGQRLAQIIVEQTLAGSRIHRRFGRVRKTGFTG
jgi:uncharacterized cofD-like protein